MYMQKKKEREVACVPSPLEQTFHLCLPHVYVETASCDDMWQSTKKMKYRHKTMDILYKRAICSEG